MFTSKAMGGILSILAILTGCSKTLSERDLLEKRELVAAYFEERDFARAEEILQTILDSSHAKARDYVDMACIQLENMQPNDVARKYLKQAKALDDSLAATEYLWGVLALQEADNEVALASLGRSLELDPDDVPCRYQYAVALERLGRQEEATRVLREVEALGVEHTGSFHLSAIYALASFLQKTRLPEQMAEGVALKREFERLKNEEGLPKPNGEDLRRGYHGRVEAPPRPPQPAGVAAESIPLSFERLDAVVAVGAGKVAEVVSIDVDSNQRTDLVVVGDGGAVLVRSSMPSGSSEEVLTTDPMTHVIAGDVANRGRASILLFGPSGSRFLVPDEAGAYHEASLPIAEIRAACFVDVDHEGDLDLVIAGPERLHLLRNDGWGSASKALPSGAKKEEPQPGPEQVIFVDATEGARLPVGRFDWIAIEDFDFDQDIDLLVGGTDVTTEVVSNLRKLRFETYDASRTGISTPTMPQLRDLNHDGRVDLLVGNQVLTNRGELKFEAAGAPLASDGAVLVDLDLDGNIDAVWMNDASPQIERGSLLASPPLAPESVPIELASRLTWNDWLDVDGDGDVDFVAGLDRGLQVWRSNTSPRHRALRVELTGLKDNLGGVGAIVETRGGDFYDRILYRGTPMAFGIGAGAVPATVRVLWPNGVIQYSILPPSHDVLRIQQKEGLVGSCPFLYTCDGESYQFISDILGITPLGLPMEEGLYVPPDHDELVRIDGSLLRPVDGEYRMQITEELREVTYLDRAQLWVVDHDEKVEVHPEERFTFPPFPPLKIHTVRDPLPIDHAVDGDGRDWTAELRAIDGDHAVPFKPRPSQFLGLVTPHDLEITLPAAVRDAKVVRLLMTGWLYWTDASVNVAAGHHAEYAFVPPTFSIPDATGTFRPMGPPIGFPAGKTKTMVVDVSNLINRDDPRIRIHASIRLYWDAIEVAVDDDDAPIVITKLEPSHGELYYRGFSRPFPPNKANQPERFLFEELRDPMWDQHRGMLTRYGDVLELLREIDDRYALFGAGDAIDLRFDAKDVPELTAGMARTYLLFVDGWAKDGDPNTYEGGKVDPLPFHGMSGYPYRSDESYPSDPAHADYRRDWNTRPGRRLIPSLANPEENP